MIAERSGPVAWLPWEGASFASAEASGRPILLSVGVSWCPWCAEMAQTTYRDPEVCRIVERRFVPIQVDADERPDIGDRYTLGAWPTTAFLTSDGQLLGGERYVTPSRMVTLLAQVADAYAVRREQLSTSVTKPSIEGPSATAGKIPDLDAWLAEQLLEDYDPLHGGFGTGAKRVQAPPLRVAFGRYQTGDTRMENVLIRTLDAIGWSELYDSVDGGVFRSCSGRDWTDPSVEKLLSVNAHASLVLLEGWAVLGEARYRDRACDVLRYVGRVLADRPDGGFFASQFADDTYYASGDRRGLPPPPIDRRLYIDRNAEMATAFIRGAALVNDQSLLEFAVSTIERVVGGTYDRGHGIAHGLAQESPRGLLADQVRASDTLIDLHQATDRDVYLDVAQELMRFSVRALCTDLGCGLRDRVVSDEDVGLLREPATPFVDNCEAARVLARLAHVTGDRQYRQQAEAILISQAGRAQTLGIDAAPFVLACWELQA